MGWIWRGAPSDHLACLPFSLLLHHLLLLHILLLHPLLLYGRLLFFCLPQKSWFGWKRSIGPANIKNISGIFWIWLFIDILGAKHLIKNEQRLKPHHNIAWLKLNINFPWWRICKSPKDSCRYRCHHHHLNHYQCHHHCHYNPSNLSSICTGTPLWLRQWPTVVLESWRHCIDDYGNVVNDADSYGDC